MFATERERFLFGGIFTHFWITSHWISITLDNLMIIYVPGFRNRYCELKKYILPLNEDGDLQDFSITPREIATMKACGSLELPPSFVRGIRESPKFKYKRELVCASFKVGNTSPENIVLLTDNRVMYCTHFKEEHDPQDEYSSHFTLEGYLFKSVKPAWVHPCSSERIGYFIVSKIDLSNIVSISAMDLVSKCLLLPREPSIERSVPESFPVPVAFLALNRGFVAAECRQSRELFIAKMKIFAEEFKSQDSYRFDFFYAESLHMPGRHRNFFQ